MEKEKEKEKKPMSTGKKIGIGCGSCLGLVVLIIIISVIAGGKGDKNSNNSGSTAKNSTQQTNAKKEYGVGDEIQLKNHTLKVNSVDKDYKSGNQFDKPQDSNNSFVVADVTVTNTGDSDLSVNEFGFKLEDDTGTQRDTTIGIVDGPLQSVTLSKGGKTSGKLIFEAKKGSSTLKLHYSPGMFGGSEVTINL